MLTQRSRAGMTLTDLLAALGAAGVLACALAPLASSRSRAASRADVCTMHQQQIIGGLSSLADEDRHFPPSYVYGSATIGIDWRHDDQLAANPTPVNGLVHWSGMLLARDFIADEGVFQCPDVLRGGAPATNPGPIASNWEPGQVNELGSGVPSVAPHDRQAARVAYTANAAVMPRNRFTSVGAPRVAQQLSSASRQIPAGVSKGRPEGTDLTRPHVVREPVNTIIVTEFAALPTGGWSSLATPEGVIKSHRPVTPFVGVSSGTNVFQEPNGGSPIARFLYPRPQDILPTNQLSGDLLHSTPTELNAVGRHHPGGTARFAYIDGHVESDTVQQTVANRRWGDRFYSITGNNSISSN